MRPIRLLAIAALLFAISIAGTGISLAAELITLTGQVSTLIEGMLVPVDAAVVTLIAHPAHKSFETTTDASGQFKFTNLPPGTYALHAEADGLGPYDDALEVGNSAEIDIILASNAHMVSEIVVEESTDAPDKPDAPALRDRELAERLGQSLGHILDELPGVEVLESGTVAKPLVQGMVGSRVLLLHDGIRHEAQSWGVDHGPELDPFAAENITVVKGASGVRYGAGALGGAVILEPPAIPTDGPLRGEVNTVYLSNGRTAAGSLALRSGVPGIHGMGWRLQTSAKRAGSLDTPDYPLDNTGVREFNVSGALGYEADRWGIEVAASRYDSTVGIFTGQYYSTLADLENAFAVDEPPNVEFYERSYDIDRPRQEVSHLQLSGKIYAFVGRGQLEVIAAYQQNDRQEFDIVRSNVTGPQLDFNLQTWHGELIYRRPLSTRLGLEAGVTATYQRNIYEGRRFIPNYRRSAGGAFGILSYNVKSWRFETGARFDADNMETFQRERVGGASADIESYDLSFTNPSLTASSRYTAPDNTFVWDATLASTGRAPSINELFVDGESQTLAAFEVGDRTMDSEQTYAITTGLQWSPVEELELAGTAFGQFFDGYIALVPQIDANGEPLLTLTSSGAFPTFAYEQVDASFYGGDIQAKYQVLSWLQLHGQASSVVARNTTDNEYLPYIPTDRGSLGFALSAPEIGPSRENVLDVTWGHVAQSDRYDVDADFTPPPPHYDLLRASISGRVPLGATTRDAVNLFWQVEARNLLDESYRDYLSRLRYFADQPGRSINVRLKATF